MGIVMVLRWGYIVTEMMEGNTLVAELVNNGEDLSGCQSTDYALNYFF